MNDRQRTTNVDDFQKIPGSPITYWVSERLRSLFEKSDKLGEKFSAKIGLKTGDNDRFIRNWYEVNFNNIGFSETRESAMISEKKWFPHNKGGNF